MPEYSNYFRSSFHSIDDANNGKGITPVIFDIVSPDGETSLLPDDMKMVLHVNPNSMQISRSKLIERIQTLGGWVEQHWGDAPTEITLEMSTGGFMRLYTGLTSSTGMNSDVANKVKPSSMAPMVEQGNSARRETIAYDKYLDLLALFHNNGAIYDAEGRIVMTGQIKLTFDGHNYFGWFSSFSVSESAEQPYMFKLSASFQVQRESHTLYTTEVVPNDYSYPSAEDDETGGWG